MRKKLAVLALISTLVGAAVFTPSEQAKAANSASPIVVLVNYQKVDFPDSINPYIVSGTTMVPVRGVFEKMNAEVTWKRNAAGKIEVTAKHFNDVATMTVGSKQATSNGKPITLNAPAENKNGRVSVPLRFISEAFGGAVNWIPKSESGNSFDYIRVDGQFQYPNIPQEVEMTYHQTGKGDPIEVKSFPVVIKHPDKMITIRNITNSYSLWNKPNSKRLYSNATINNEPDFSGMAGLSIGLIRMDVEVQSLKENVLFDEMIDGKQSFFVTSNSVNPLTTSVPWQIKNGILTPDSFEGFLNSKLLQKDEKISGTIPFELYEPAKKQNIIISVDSHDTLGVSLKLPTLR